MNTRNLVQPMGLLAAGIVMLGIATAIAEAASQTTRGQGAKDVAAQQRTVRPGNQPKPAGKGRNLPPPPTVKLLPASGLLIPLDLTGLVNTKPANLGSSAAIDPQSVPKGSKTIDGVPFAFVEKEEANLVDVSPSMRGFQQGDKLKFTYLGGRNPKSPVPEFPRVKFQVPSDDYAALHLVACSAGRSDHASRMTVRVGYFGNAAAIFADTVVHVPEVSAAPASNVVSAIPVRLADGRSGNVYHVRVPLAQTANVREYETFDVEFTRDMNVSPEDAVLMPAGQPSDVVVLAATLERSPLQMQLTCDEAGHIFSEGQKALFRLELTNVSKKAVAGKVVAACSGPGTDQEVGTQPKQFVIESPFEIQSGKSQVVPLDVTPPLRGWYSCRIAIEARKIVLRQKDTSFALIAPDTRKAMEDSPFGIWCFWNSHFTTHDANRIERLASIIHKGGWRWTYGGKPTEGSRGYAPAETYQMLRDKYRITFNCQYPPHAKEIRRADGYKGVHYDEQTFKDEVIPWLTNAKQLHFDPSYIVLHESRLNTALLRRFSELFGGDLYPMPPEEQALYDRQFENTRKFCQGIKHSDPAARIVLFNDYPAMGAEHLKRGFPADLFDIIGSEGAMFQRQPERQPDWLCLLGILHEWKRIEAKYGYHKPIWFTEALYHGTNPGNLSLHDQAVIYVREALLGLQLGVERFAMCGTVGDCTGDYGWSGWGHAGMCFRDPDYAAKPSFAMYAWLTQVLDQAKPVGKVSSDSTVLHVLKFRKPDGRFVNPVWVVRGRQQVTLELAGSAKPTVYDVFGNVMSVPAEGGKLTLEIGDSPLYVCGGEATKVTSAVPQEVKADKGSSVLQLDGDRQFKAVKDRNKLLENNAGFPRIQGNFKTEIVKEDGKPALRLELLEDQDPRKLFGRYVELTLAQPVELPGRPQFITAHVMGNGGWGRIMFELTDAKGRIWSSAASQDPVGSADACGDSFISFVGWHTIRMPLPGQYAGNDQSIHWPRTFEWSMLKPSEKPAAASQSAADVDAEAALKGKGSWERVEYPLKLTKIVFEARPSILYVDEERPVTKRTILIDRIGVIEAPEGK